LTAHRLNDG